MFLAAGYLGLFCQRARCCCTPGCALSRTVAWGEGAATENSGYRWAGVEVGGPGKLRTCRFLCGRINCPHCSWQCMCPWPKKSQMRMFDEGMKLIFVIILKATQVTSF